MQVLRGLAAQVGGVALTALIITAVGRPFPLFWAAVTAAGCAVFLSQLVLRQPYWWGPIHVVFLPLSVVVSHPGLGAGVWLAGLVVLTLVFWRTVTGDVPLFLSSDAVARAVGDAVVAQNAVRVADLGAGVGTVAVPVAQKFPDVALDAWERAPAPYLICRWRARHLPGLRVRREDLWSADLAQYDVVFAFLSPRVMERLEQKALAEMRPGTLLVSAAFACPTWLPEGEVTLDDTRKTRLFFYRVA